MEEKHINKKITFSIVAVLLIVLVTIGATYAYFSAQAQTDVQTVTTGTLTMGFTNGEIINATGITPINDSEIKTKATELPFSITNTGNQHMNITIKLTDITIDDALKDIDFRWGLYNADTDKGVSFGIFKYSQTGGEEILLRDVILDKGSATKNYVLRIWLHDDGALQNEMQGKTFSGKVVVTGEAIEYTPETCFEFSDGTITGYDAETCGTDVVIPRTIDNTSVTSIGDYAFQGKVLTSVIIPDSVTAIGDEAFIENYLTHITIPNSITSIGVSAFFGNSISNVFIPENINLGEGTFEYTQLNSIVISSPNVQSGFLLQNDMHDIILMNGVTAIDTMVFEGSLTTIEIPSSVTSISAGAFAYSTNLNEIIIRGRTSIPAGFEEDWNCVDFEYTNGEPCTEYANVIYRP